MSGSDPDPSPITRVLADVSAGNSGAYEELAELVYGALRSMARNRLARLKAGETLQATALVHEAWLRLCQDDDWTWRSRRHFFSAAARAMRNILVEQARRKGRLKRGGDLERVEIRTDHLGHESRPSLDVLALDESLTRLESEYPRSAKVVSLRTFTGATNEEIAEILEISPRTVDREWLFARTWLRRELGS